MHVAHLTIPFEYACGISRHVLLLAKEQATRHRVSVITPSGSATSLLDDNAIPWLAMPIGASQKNPWHATQAVTGLLAYVRRERVDILHAHHRYPALLARLVAAILSDVHAVATCHYLVDDVRHASYPVERIIAVSEATRRHLIERLGVKDDRICVVPNVLAPADRQSQTDAACPMMRVDGEVPLLVGVGRLEHDKGFSTLIEAAARLRNRPKPPAVIIVGDGPMRGELETLARERGVELWISGIVPSVWPYLRRADVFVHPSLVETFGLAVAEAGLAGCAVVCSNVGGLPELVSDQITGMLVPPQDPGALAQAIADLLDDEPKRQRLSVALHDSIAARARPEVMADATAEVYASVLRRG